MRKNYIETIDRRTGKIVILYIDCAYLYAYLYASFYKTVYAKKYYCFLKFSYKNFEHFYLVYFIFIHARIPRNIIK
jgi:hypothetical protein